LGGYATRRSAVFIPEHFAIVLAEFGRAASHRRPHAIEGEGQAHQAEPALRHFLDHADRRFKGCIARLTHGTWRAEEAIDNDCFEPIDGKITVALTVEDGRLIVDFAGTTAQVRGFKNSSIANSYSAVYMALASFFEPDLPRNDLWEQAESGLSGYLREHGEIERQLLNVPLETLSPADLLFRAMVLEERGAYAEAKAAAKLARVGLYTSAYRSCYESQRAYVVERLAATSGASPLSLAWPGSAPE